MMKTHFGSVEKKNGLFFKFTEKVLFLFKLGFQKKKSNMLKIHLKNTEIK